MTGTPRLGHAPIAMRHVGPPPYQTNSVYDGCELLKRRGDFYWQVHGDKRRLVIAMPCQPEYRARCGLKDGADFIHSYWTIDYPNAGSHRWSWDGNEGVPTVTPSLHAEGVWHGHATAGHLKEA